MACAPPCLEHEAFIYGSDEEYVDALMPFLEEGRRRGDTLLVVVPGRNAESLRAALGRQADAVEFVDATQWYRQPSRTIAGYENRLRALGGAPASVIGEVNFGDSVAEWTAWTRYESVINDVFARYQARVVCPYDERSLPAHVVRDASRTHPLLSRPGGPAPSGSYLDPGCLLDRLPSTVALPSRAPDLAAELDGRLRQARRNFSALLRGAGGSPERVDELTLGLSEVLANAFVHGGGTAWQRVWIDPERRHLTCVVEDEGERSADPLAGFRPPRPGATHGYGLWLARQFFDHSEIASRPSGGWMVSLWARF